MTSRRASLGPVWGSLSRELIKAILSELQVPLQGETGASADWVSSMAQYCWPEREMDLRFLSRGFSLTFTVALTVWTAYSFHTSFLSLLMWCGLLKSILKNF